MEFQIIKNSELLEVILMPDDDSNLTDEQVEESVSDLAEIEPETLSFVEIYLK